jgi:hypothetical protein
MFPVPEIIDSQLGFPVLGFWREITDQFDDYKFLEERTAFGLHPMFQSTFSSSKKINS